MAPRRHLGMLCVVLLGACSPGACNQQACRPEEAAVDGACVKRCNVQQDCLGVETCEDGLCRLAGGTSSGAVGGSSSSLVTSSPGVSSSTASSAAPGSSAPSSSTASSSTASSSTASSSNASSLVAPSSSQASSGFSVDSSSAGGSSSTGVLPISSSAAGSSTSLPDMSSSLAAGSSSSSGAAGLVLDVVLHGTAQMGTQAATVDLPTTVDPARALLFFGVSTADASPPCVMVTGTVLSGVGGPQLEFRRNHAAGCRMARVVWHVAVFSSGVQVQRGQFVPTAAATSVPLPAAVDPNRSLAMAWMRADTSKVGEREALDATLTGTTLELETTLAPTNGVVVWQVAQVEGLMAVQLPFTLGPGVDHVDLTNPSLLPASHVVHFRMIHPDQDTDDTFLNARHVNGRTNTRVERVGVGGTMLGHVQWLAWPTATITQLEDAIAGNFFSTTIPATLDPVRTFPMVPGWAHAASRSAGGGNDVLPGLALHTTTLDPMQVVAERGDSGETTHLVVQLVQF